MKVTGNSRFETKKFPPVNRKFPLGLLKMNTFPVSDNSASQSLSSLFVNEFTAGADREKLK